MKNQTIAFSVLAVMLGLTGASTAQANSPDLLRKALSASFEERAEVVKTYESHGVSGPSEETQRAKSTAPIGVEVGDDLAGRGGAGEQGLKARGGRDVYRETRIAEKLDRELREVDRSLVEHKENRDRSRAARPNRGDF